MKYAKYQTAMGTAAVGWRLDPACIPNITVMEQSRERFVLNRLTLARVP